MKFDCKWVNGTCPDQDVFGKREMMMTVSVDEEGRTNVEDIIDVELLDKKEEDVEVENEKEKEDL